MKQEMDTDISGEYVDDDKPYQTEGDGEIGTYESGSQDNGNFTYRTCAKKLDKIKKYKVQFKIEISILNNHPLHYFLSASKTDDDYDKPKLATPAELGIYMQFYII